MSLIKGSSCGFCSSSYDAITTNSCSITRFTLGFLFQQNVLDTSEGKLCCKTGCDLTGEDLLKCAQHIETTPQGTSAELQSAKILECLHKKPSLLRCHVGNRKSILSDQLSSVDFIKPSNRRDSFPASLPWCCAHFNKSSPVRSSADLSPSFLNCFILIWHF
jgi:hypothetical protein